MAGKQQLRDVNTSKGATASIISKNHSSEIVLAFSLLGK